MTDFRQVEARPTIGDRVRYTSGAHDESTSNPLWGSVYACEGYYVSYIEGSPCPIRVKWDNGRENFYRREDLTVVPNQPTKDALPEIDQDFWKFLDKKGANV